MTPERQNEIWAMLTQAEKERYSKKYLAPIKGDWDKGFKAALCSIFGKHNLTAQAEEKPKEPRFKVGDLVYVPWLTHKRKAIITDIDSYGCYAVRDFENNTLRNFEDSELEPYTEPKEEVKISTENEQNSFNVVENVKISTKEDAYFAYRLDLAKEIAVAMMGKWSNADFIPHDSVQMANEIVKRLKETEE